MIVRILLYFLLLIFSYGAFLLATMPAGLAWDVANKHVIPTNALPVKISGVSGSIWDGRANISYQGLSGQLRWNAQLNELWRGSLPVKLKANGNFLDLKGRLVAGLNSIKLEGLSGSVNVSEINPLLKRHRLQLDGDVIANNLSVALEDKRLQHVSGQFSWSGGAIQYPAGRALHKRTLTSFRGNLVTDKGDFLLKIRDAEGSFDSISGALKPDGWAMFEVKRRILDLAEEPWPSNSTEQDTVFKVKRKIF